MRSTASWTEQTSAPLESGLYLAHCVRHADAGAFPLAYWTDDGSEEKGPHGHTDAHFMLVTSGHYETAARLDAGAPEILLIFNPAGTYHCDHLHGGGAFFTITMPQDCWRDLGTGRLPRASQQIASPRAQTLVRRALRELADGSADSDSVAEGVCWELMGFLNAEDDARCPPQWLPRACDYLRDNFADAVDLRRLSGELGIHPVHLTRTFRNFLRCTPGEYLRAQRLDYAARLLTQGRRGLAQIAFESGFSDQSHLNRHFGRAYGVSPGQYRQLTRGN